MAPERDGEGASPFRSSRVEGGAWAVLGATLLLRLTLRDRWVWSGVWFYVTPRPLLAAACGLGFVWFRRKAWLVAAAGFAVWSLGEGFRFRDEPIPEKAIHLRVWNAGNPASSFKERTRFMVEGAPDFLVLTDSGGLGRWWEEASRVPTGYRVAVMGRGFTFFVRDGMEVVFEGWIAESGKHARLGRVRLPGLGEAEEGLDVLLVELDFHPLRAKSAGFSALQDLAANAPPSLMLGDFNVPRDSYWARDLTRAGYPAAFDLAGRGWQGGWPAPVPLKGLVQARGKRGTIHFHRATHGPRWGSDHRSLDIWFTAGSP